MLDITFYSKNGQAQDPELVEVSEEMYQWLIKSDFSKIGKSVPRYIDVDGQKEKLEVVQLTSGNRKKLKDFLEKAIVKISREICHKLGEQPSMQELKQYYTERLLKLDELLKFIENEKYFFLQRV